MQEKPYRDELETRASAEMERLQQDRLTAMLQSRSAIRQQIEAMAGEGKVNFMSDEEVALLHNFRRFKAGLARGKRGTFQFKTFPDERAIVPGSEVSLVHAPSGEQDD